MGFVICFRGAVKAAVSNLFTSEPRFTQPNLPPLFFEPGSSEYSFAKSENSSPLYILFFKLFKNKTEDFLAVSLGLIFIKQCLIFAFKGRDGKLSL